MKSRSGKKVAVVVVSILLIIAVGIFIGWHSLKNMLASKKPETQAKVAGQVEKTVLKASDSLYHIAYSSFNLNTDSGYAQITNLVIEPDPAIYHKMLAENKAPNSIFTFKTDKFIMTGLKFGKQRQGRLLQVGNILIDNPSVRITNKINGDKNDDDSTSLLSRMVKNIFKKIDFNHVNLVNIDNTRMNNLNLVFVNDNGSAARTTALHGLTFNIDHISIGDSSAHDSAARLQTQSVKIGYVRMATADNLYYLDMKNIALGSGRNNVLIGTASLIPRLSKAGFYKAVKEQNDRYELTYDNISMHLDMKKLLREQQFHISTMAIDRSQAEIYTNYNWPLHQAPDRRGRYPHHQLQQLAFDITIDTLHVRQGDIYYRIVAKKSDKEATYSLLHTQGTLYNITNNIAAKKANPYAIADLQTNVMGAGLIHTVYTFNLADKNAPYKVTAALGAMDAKALNPLTEPLSLMEIREGQINKMDLTMNVDEYKATGNVNMYYKGIKVNMLKRDKDDSSLHTMRLVSSLTNLTLPNDNPAGWGISAKGR